MFFFKATMREEDKSENGDRREVGQEGGSRQEEEIAERRDVLD